jgi:uncharacterized protein
MARREVFVDTSALYAMVDSRDATHATVVGIVPKLIRAGSRLVVTDYVVAETVNLANARRSSFVAQRVLDLLERSAGIRIEWIGSERFEATKTFFRKHADHSYSFTDCSSFVLMRELKLTEALTTDRHFKAAGMQVLLPMA